MHKLLVAEFKRPYQTIVQNLLFCCYMVELTLAELS